MSSLAFSPGAIVQQILPGRFLRWLDAMPHPQQALEISATHVAAARWGRGRLALEASAWEPIPSGAIVVSPVELNVADASSVRGALQRVLARLEARGPDVVLLVPDPVVRVFILTFEEFPARAAEAAPLLRWRLKKSVPFDVEDTVVSYFRQPSDRHGIAVVAAVARQRIIRQYEELAEAAGLGPGVVMGSTLATLPLVEDSQTTLLARMAGATLTTVIVHAGRLLVYRSTQMPATAAELAPQALLDELYPAAAYYQDTWGAGIEQVRLAGLGARFDEFRRSVESELGCKVAPLAASAALEERVTGEARSQLDQRFDALVGWMLNRGA